MILIILDAVDFKKTHFDPKKGFSKIENAEMKRKREKFEEE